MVSHCITYTNYPIYERYTISDNIYCSALRVAPIVLFKLPTPLADIVSYVILRKTILTKCTVEPFTSCGNKNFQ